MDIKTDKKKYSSLAPAVEQAAEILKYLASSPKIKASLSTISREVEINKSKTYAILGALKLAGFVAREEESKLYFLGPEIIPIGQKALNNIDYRAHADPFLKKLSSETKCTAMLGIIFGQKLIIVSKESSGHEYESTVDIGTSFYVYFKSHGMAILASLPEAELEKEIAGDNFFNGISLNIKSSVQLRKEIKKVNKNGYAMNTGNFSPWIKILSSAVIGYDNYPKGALILMGLIKETDISSYGKKLVKSARGLSNVIG